MERTHLPTERRQAHTRYSRRDTQRTRTHNHAHAPAQAHTHTRTPVRGHARLVEWREALA
ncbi:hypothetical protein HOU11_gp01 [Pectobacterium phage Gaspode]|uniref:Uncharacterized protein n=1 Tax=Pectobacterium phage Gaspode TaxID=2320194 RepID=A0A385IF80_9CAUD|nr:hypothetical protein HOU11_gp01 [Pectobacterium phage Gaspode]AXY81658.1 hypothetical protein [Pectobacterium phage Gaspode]